MADNLVAALSRVSSWMVTSRLSTAALGNRHVQPRALCELLDTQYLVQGKVHRHGGQLELVVEVYEHKSGQTIWSGAQRGNLSALLQSDDPITLGLSNQLAQGLLQRQFDLAHEAALPTLADYTLLLMAITSLHSLGPNDGLRAREALEHLVERYPRSAEARAWLAKWHFLQLAQNTATDFAHSAALSKAMLARALDESPDHAFALAMSGHLLAFADRDLDAAEPLLRRAVSINPNEPLASLFLAQVLTNSGRAEQAVQAIEAAAALSPIDPLGYYFDVFAAAAYSAAGEYETALQFALRSARQNALHLSTWVQVMISQVRTGRMDDARATARRYRTLRPGASVQRFIDFHPAKGTALAQSEADALVAAGLPH